MGVPKEEMDSYSATGCSSDQCLIEVLDYWLRHHPSQLRWKEVAHALKEIKLYTLAEKVISMKGAGFSFRYYIFDNVTRGH